MHLTYQTKIVTAALIAILGVIALVQTIAAPSEITTLFNVSNESNEKSIDHSKWQEVLDAFVQEHESEINRFDYAALKEDDEAHESLIAYVLQLSDVDPRTYSKSEQLAYWINFYNALVIYVVNSRFPVKSIQEIKLAGPDTSLLDLKVASVSDQSLSLNDIRNEILRPIWKDNRVHFVLNSASLGCPNLSKEAFTSENVYKLLDSGTKAYLNHTRGVLIKEGKLTISSIFEWYMEDFGQDKDEVITYLKHHVQPDVSKKLGELSEFETIYDWKINSP